MKIEEIIGSMRSEAVAASAKAGIGVTMILRAIISKIPPPQGDPVAPSQALIFDSWYDPYKGVVLVRILDGALRKGREDSPHGQWPESEVLRVGVFSPHPCEIDQLSAGEVGFITAAISRTGCQGR